jgi:signal transduction histidine kinase
LKEKIVEFKNKFISFLKKKTNTVSAQLTIGIAVIVFSSTLMIALIFLSQYQKLSLRQAENELNAKSEELAGLGHMLLTTTMPISSRELLQQIKRITNSDFWIITTDGEVVVSTTDIENIDRVASLNQKYLSEVRGRENKITYDYSDYFDTKTLSVISPIDDKGRLIGIVIVHKEVSVIYQGNAYYNILIFISLIVSLILSIILGRFYSEHFTRPLKRLTEVSNEISNHNYDIKTGIVRTDEIGELANSIDMMSTKISENIEDIKALEGRAKELVANVSHEFKTPLTLIRGYTLNLADKTTKPSSEVYDKIIKNTIILEKLVNELLDLSKLQSGNVVLKKESLELKQLITDVASDMKSIAKEKNIKIRIKETFKDTQIIEADYVKIRQLFTIFMDNAIKYSNEDGLVNVTILKSEVIISDNGIGIEQSKLEQLFERYYQVDHNEKGYGLGLCIAKYIADAHGYKILVNSVPNKGTDIHIIF